MPDWPPAQREHADVLVLLLPTKLMWRGAAASEPAVTIESSRHQEMSSNIGVTSPLTEGGGERQGRHEPVVAA
ncbi:hypothetical protein CFC21_098638 [Triticum aestivum]|uniref:Uncharacterized protein n=2 Tax=Triticum aestivum TaxID=4565 RepID=A0A3B6RIQ4_WHEAT|nr:hypothetical protein CFC21_098638 [Triticum aestivum]